MRNLIVASGLICILALVSTLVYNNNKNEAPIVTTTILSECPLEKMSCIISIPNGQTLSFHLEPKGLPVMEPLMLSVAGLGAIKKSALKVWFEGKSMNMGVHYMLPAPINNKFSDQMIFKGMIPVCSIDKEMVWLLNVDISINSQAFKIQFQLKPSFGD